MAQLTRTMMPSGLSRFGMMNAFLLASIPMAIIIPFIWLKRLGITSPINTNKETQLHGMPMRGDYAMRSSLTNRQPYQYSASPLEQYFLDNVEEFGLLQDKHIETCPLVFNASSPINTEVLTYFDELEVYNQAMDKFEPITQDIRINIQPGEANIEEVCSSTKIHPNGLKGIFSSRVSSSNYHGGMEPLLPIQRSQKICNDTKKSDLFKQYVMNMDYLVHDFYSFCKTLKRHSRTVFIDMGASLFYHGAHGSPAVYVHKLYSKFGFKFDHIYAYEISKTEPANVFKQVPDELMASFHWINVGVSSEQGNKLNPFTTLLNNFNQDDFVVVKLDIDTPALENKLAMQLRDDPKLLELVDVFYYEHHVKQMELALNWKSRVDGSVGGSLKMMADIRARGVSSHYWV